MEKVFKLSIASFLIVCLSVATVVCCCIAPAVMTHFHKVSVCHHCQLQNSSHGKSSNSAGACQYYLTNGESSHSQTIFPSATLITYHIAFVSFNRNLTAFLPSPAWVYPPGSPPLIAHIVPIYLSTHSLRI